MTGRPAGLRTRSPGVCASAQGVNLARCRRVLRPELRDCRWNTSDEVRRTRQRCEARSGQRRSLPGCGLERIEDHTGNTGEDDHRGRGEKGVAPPVAHELIPHEYTRQVTGETSETAPLEQ